MRYPYYQIAEPITEYKEGFSGETVFTDCLVLHNMPHPETDKRYLLAKKFPTLGMCTIARNELVPDAEYIVKTYLPRINSRQPKMRWYRIPKP